MCSVFSLRCGIIRAALETSTQDTLPCWAGQGDVTVFALSAVRLLKRLWSVHTCSWSYMVASDATHTPYACQQMGQAGARGAGMANPQLGGLMNGLGGLGGGGGQNVANRCLLERLAKLPLLAGSRRL